jgi:hypothetical protein
MRPHLFVRCKLKQFDVNNEQSANHGFNSASGQQHWQLCSGRLIRQFRFHRQHRRINRQRIICWQRIFGKRFRIGKFSASSGAVFCVCGQ